MHILPINRAPSTVHINLTDLQEPLALPQVPNNPEHQNDGDGKHDIEPALDVRVAAANRTDSDIELRSKDQDDERQTGPCAVDAEDGLMRDLVDGVALCFPGLAEADVRLAFVNSM